MYFRVDVGDGEHCRTDEHPHLPDRLFDVLPSIRHHSCDNDERLSFEAEAQDTEIAHLIEHLVIELQVQAIGGALSGETSWDWTRDPHGCFHVAVGYDNRDLAVGSVRLAMRIINAIDARQAGSIDIDREVARLRRIARQAPRSMRTRAGSPAKTARTPAKAG